MKNQVQNLMRRRWLSPLLRKMQECTGNVGDLDPLLGYIAWFTNVVELYQKKNCICFGCGRPQSPGERLPKKTGESYKEGRFKLKRGDSKEGRPILSEVGGCPTGHPRQCSLSIKTFYESPLPEPRPAHVLEWA